MASGEQCVATNACPAGTLFRNSLVRPNGLLDCVCKVRGGEADRSTVKASSSAACSMLLLERGQFQLHAGLVMGQDVAAMTAARWLTLFRDRQKKGDANLRA